MNERREKERGEERKGEKGTGRKKGGEGVRPASVLGVVN
jgi:hypothetical protein